jgi:hypothetical protein
LGREGKALGEEYFDPPANVERYQEAFADIEAGLEALPGEVSASSAAVQQLYGGLRGELAGGATQLAGGYADILGRARGLVSELGEAERQDINRRFGEAGTEAQMGLSARGLGGSTISSSVGAGIERERSTALLGLQEQTARQRLGVEATFGLPGLTAQERLLGAGVNLGAAQAGALERGGSLYANTALNTLGTRANIAAGETRAYTNAAINRVQNLYQFDTYPIETQMQGAGMAMNWRGPFMAIQPQATNYATVQPYGGF